MTAPLKPCPFCGGAVHVDVSDDQTVATISCTKGSSCIGSGLLIGFMTRDEASAVAQWNTRADAPELAALLTAADRLRRNLPVAAIFADSVGAKLRADFDAALAAYEAVR